MLEVLITLLIAVIVFALLWWVINAIPFPEPIAKFRWVLLVILVLIAIVWLVQRFGLL